MDTIFQPGQLVVLQENEVCLKGKVLGIEGVYTIVQFEGVDYPTLFDEAFVKRLELLENGEEQKQE